jgi:hypothetical protein
MAEILTSDITTKVINGTGTFDELMVATTAHLREEYNRNRIKGSDYSSVYLQSLTTVLQQSISFILERQQADKQAELIDSQKELLVQQIIGAALDNDLKAKQIEKMDAEIALAAQQVSLSEQQEINLVSDNAKTISETALLDQNKLNAIQQGNLIVKQQAKVESETALLGQKKFSEEAQIVDTVNGSEVVGMIGKQKNLYQAQRDGFDRDAEQKLIKIMTDTYVAQGATDGAFNSTDTHLGNEDIGLAMSKALTEIGVTPYTP